MITDLDRIVASLAQLGRRFPALLLPGLSKREIESWEAKLPFSLTRELDSLYQWRNGTRAYEGDLLGDLYFFPGFYLLSLEEAVQTYKEREDAPQWRKGWFPLFADGAGDFYLIRCTRKKTDSSGVIGFIHGEPEQILEYESLPSMIRTLADCYAEGAFFLDEDGYLDMDDEEHRRIAHKHNPGVSEWQS
jgi:cell wall assembly regulator SMI1